MRPSAATMTAKTTAADAAPAADGTAPRPELGEDQVIRFENVSRFYGEVLGVNRVNLTIGPGVTSLVGPNGSGKSTLMNLMTGLIRPSRGRLRVLGLSPSDPERFFRVVGYCASSITSRAA